MHWLAIFVGGGLGAVARFALGRAVLAQAGDGFPWGTLAVNGLGCLAIGLAAAWLVNEPVSQTVRLLVLTGLLGGFTTFSAFGLETVELAARGASGLAAAYVAASVIGGLACVGLGLAMGRSLAG